jgi:hypothetical protein
MERLKRILEERKRQGVKWDELAANLPIKGNALRTAFTRNSVNDIYLKEVEKVLAIGNQNMMHEENAAYVTGRNIMMIPVVGQRAQAGFLVGYGDNEYLESLPKIPYEVDKEYRGKYVCFEVSGDSMDDNTADAILENDVLVCREIQRHHWTNKLHINKWDFVLVHKEMGIVVKRITKHDTQKGILTLHSLNDMYEDYDVNMDDLITIFNVVDVTRSRRR